jgi:hypothetical protein
MLKGLRGILEKGLQIAAPIIGGSMFGAPGAMFGSGIASLLSGDKVQDALIKAGMSGIAGYRGADNISMIDRMTGGRMSPEEFKVITGKGGGAGRGGTQLMQNLMNKMDTRKPGGFIDTIFSQRGTETDPKPSFGMQAISAGLPAYLSYLAAKEDAKKPGPEDPSKYMSAVDTMYGGQFERPPEERRIQNLMPTYKAAGGMMGQQPVNGLKAMEPVQYSAMTGQGIMGMAKGGDVFPRKTGQIEGPGTKTSDSIPAMLSDGEFVQRTDAVNGAGVMMGAKNANEARKKGADFMYALQDKLAKMGQRVA